MKVKRVGEMDHKSMAGTQNQVGNELDHMLDTALAKYAAAQPRTGLEERVLANLWSEQTRVPHGAWWRWGLAGAVASIVVVAVLFGWRSVRTTPPLIATHPSAVPRSSSRPVTQVARSGENAIRPERHAPNRSGISHRSQLTVATADPPKLDQFPSLRPLSEQEKMLLDYVARYPAEAAMIAQTQTALREREEQEELEKYGPPPAGTEPQNRQQWDSPNL